MSKKTLLLVGDHANEVQRTELMREMEELERAGFKVLIISDYTTDHDTGERMKTMWKALMMDMMTNVDCVAMYFTDECEVSNAIIGIAKQVEIDVRFSMSMHWSRGKDVRVGFLEAVMEKFSSIASKWRIGNK